MMDKKKEECMACIGFDGEHTCEGFELLQYALKHRYDCNKCTEKDKRIEGVWETIRNWEDQYEGKLPTPELVAFIEDLKEELEK